MTPVPAKKTLWINESTRSGKIEIEGKKYLIGAHNFPRDERAEELVLGSIYVAGETGKGNESFKHLRSLRADDFFWIKHALQYRAMERIEARGQQIDTLTVAIELSAPDKNGKPFLDTIGGEAYLNSLTRLAGVNAQSYAQRVIQAALGRAIMVASDVLKQVGEKVLEMELVDLQVTLPQAIRDISVRLHTLSEQNSFPLADAMAGFINQIKTGLADEDYEPGISTGYFGIDQMTLGWRKKKLYLVAAPSGWGKTALILGSALDALRQGRRVLLISLEMSLDEILERMVVIWSQMDYTRFQKLSKGDWSAEETARVFGAMKEICELQNASQFMVVCLNNPSLAQIESKLIEYQIMPGYDVAFIDYVGFDTIQGTDEGSDFQRTSEIYKALKVWKTEYDTPIIAGCQMNKDWEKRGGNKAAGTGKGRPEIGDIYCGSVAKWAADAIMFIYQPSMVQDLPESDEAEIIFRKNRSGKHSRDDGSVLMTWKSNTLTFKHVAENVERDLSLL